MPRHASIEQAVTGRDGRPGIVIRFDYHEGLKDALKSEIPRDDRRWDPDAGGWWISEDHRERAEFLVLQYFGHATLLGLEGEDDTVLTRGGERLSQTRLF